MDELGSTYERRSSSQVCGGISCLADTLGLANCHLEVDIYESLINLACGFIALT